MSRLRLPLLLAALALAVQSLLIAAAAAGAAIAGEAMDDWEQDEDILAHWHEPMRYLNLATQLDPFRGAYFEALGRLEALLADRAPELGAGRRAAARRAYEEALKRTPGDGILWARHAALALESGHLDEASAALGRVVEFGAFEPPAQRIVLAGAFARWHRLDRSARQHALTLAGNGLLQAARGSADAAGEGVERFAMIDMVCRDLAARGSLVPTCRGRITGDRGD